jgi:ABC-type transport system involved in cytochrome c biogenesis permease subunit
MTHELNSIIIFIHPPLAIFGYIFIFFLCFLFTVQIIKKEQFKRMKKLMYVTWFINLLGLITGMIWAGIAWNSIWSWDPKETVTLVMFTILCISILIFEKQQKVSYIFLIITALLVILNLLITFSNFSLHSYGF